MPFWKNPIFRLELRRFTRLRVWPRGLLIVAIAGVLGGLHSVYQLWLQNLLFDTLPWNRWSFNLWQAVYNGLNPWRWISIFVVFYLIRAPMRLAEAEEYWVTRLRPREILRGKLAAAYLFFFFLFNLSLFLSLHVREAYHTHVGPSPFTMREVNYYWYVLYLNPAYYLYMILAPVYASVILTAIMLSIRHAARAIMAALFAYLVALPFAQDYIVMKMIELTQRNFTLRQLIIREYLQWVPDDVRMTYYMLMMEYFPRSVALVALMTPFAIWLFWRYERIMLANFEHRHF